MKSRQRPIRRWFIFGSLVVFAFALWVAQARTQTGKTVIVTITPGTPITVSPEPAVISKKDGDQVEWKCTTGCVWKAHFAKPSPFASDIFDNAHPRTGRVPDKTAPGLYHYAVTVNGHTIDPGVQVNP
jgi:hypothetical protein